MRKFICIKVDKQEAEKFDWGISAILERYEYTEYGTLNKGEIYTLRSEGAYNGKLCYSFNEICDNTYLTGYYWKLPRNWFFEIEKKEDEEIAMLLYNN